MSRPRNYWYGIVSKMIKSTELLEKEHTLQSSIFKHAIEDAMTETRKLPNGELRV